jgi:hypothetical protein
MPFAPQIDDPQTLTGLFPPDSDEECHEDDDDVCYEIQPVVLAGATFNVRQYDFHSHNANRVWPGTFPLADYLFSVIEESPSVWDECNSRVDDERGSVRQPKYAYNWGRVLELGTATGLLAMRLAMACSNLSREPSSTFCCTSVVTSDVDDERGDVCTNLLFNYELNELPLPYPRHVPHSWGTGWNNSVRISLESNKETLADAPLIHPTLLPFDTIVASDILLYVASYSALVQTLCELMIPNFDIGKEDNLCMEPLGNELYGLESPPKPPIFIMSWNRRLKESNEFFTRMTDAGFVYGSHGKGLYTFYYAENCCPSY